MSIETHDILWSAGLLSLLAGGCLFHAGIGLLLFGVGLMLPVLIDQLRGRG